MAYHTFSILTLDKPCDTAVDWVVEKISEAGLSIMRTFDLQVARQANIDCPCPHHGTDQCDCQMVVLLVYKPGHQPISIVAHGYDGQTWFSVVDSAQQRADPKLEAAIRHALIPQIIPANNLQTASHGS